MPQFDDLRAYLPADLQALELWMDEASRLVSAVKNPDPVLPFDGKGLFDEANEEGYQNLGRLAEMVLSALSLCMLDNECIYVKSCKPLANRDRLKKLIQQARVSQTNSMWEEAGGGEATQEQRKKKDSLLDAIFALIDYTSAILARLFAQVAVGKYWSDNVLAVLTQRVAKLKVLLIDMHANTLISCQVGEASLDQTDISSRLSNGIMDEEECEEVLRMIDAESKEGLTTTANADVARYCVDQNRFRSGIDTILRYLLLSLRFNNRSGLQATSFEICGMVYGTGFEDFKALLFQDRDLEYSASSDQDALKTAYPAFKILNEAFHQVKQNCPPKSQGNLRTTVEWRYCDAHNKRSSIALPDNAMNDLSRCEPQKAVMDSMADIISVMIPLVLTSPVVVSNLTKFRASLALACDAKDVVQPSKNKDYCAFFRMYTNQFEKDSQSWDVMRLSAAVQQGFFSRNNLIERGASSKNAGKVQSKLVDRSREMESWVIDECSVTVACKYQVCSILLVAFIIAGGGLAMIACKNRIKGVDPSNLSMYLWILAGFYLLVQKSRFVEEWPWSDFLRFRVRCRSVSELHAISGINEQLLMAKLLHDERGGSLLKTRGPYNKVFLQRDSNDGFSIDRSLHMTTLLLSGLIMLKVVTPRGQALVCLDARRGTELKVVEHQGNQAQEHLLCEDIDRLQDRYGQKKSKDRMRLQLAMSKELKWKRVQGVYKGMEAEFV
ncbi:uncharacterized protein BDZ99DRAFT_455036 [Mytilinidion resinicola]|uniref:Uncharacterized protein n=1 Tax=Mytilinidion resinicola TaxID=574789 RepID=A0A6A6Y3B7_9PEZI|nr:uncharacterized protein BDZ99DRAFT_455036 [Mytilinidion resinicola]KAF2802277.1 hypothetical protein BDZ99DRAFT_455036 [Mytilinidion resinicola]